MRVRSGARRRSGSRGISAAGVCPPRRTRRRNDQTGEIANKMKKRKQIKTRIGRRRVQKLQVCTRFVVVRLSVDFCVMLTSHVAQIRPQRDLSLPNILIFHLQHVKLAIRRVACLSFAVARASRSSYPRIHAGGLVGIHANLFKFQVMGSSPGELNLFLIFVPGYN